MTPEARKRLQECLAPGESDLYHTTVTGFTDPKTAIEWLKAFRTGELKKRTMYQRRHLIEDARMQIEKWEAIAKKQEEGPHTCPGCGTTGFTGRGLKAHRCKGVNRNAVAAIDGKAQVTTDTPDTIEGEDPRWQKIREGLATLRELGRAYLEGQAWLGWHLACLKKDHGVKRGGDRRQTAESADCSTWEEIVKAKTGLSRRTADVFIQLFEASKAKLQRVKKGPEAAEAKAALAIFNGGNPLALPPEKRDQLRDIIASLCTGETQGSLMSELGITPKPEAPKQSPKPDKVEEPTTGQLAFHFFEPLASELLRLRTDANFDKLVIALPLHPDEAHPVALSTLEADARAVLEKIEAAKAALAKPAKGTAA